MKLIRILACVAGLFVFGCQASEAKMMLFGGAGHDTYLGCLDCSEFTSDSICNEFGSYGNSFSSSSIFNKFGSFGGQFSSSSPWNQFSSSDTVPVLVDDNGGFYGYFTINQFRFKAVRFSAELKKLYEAVDGDVDLLRKGICDAF